MTAVSLPTPGYPPPPIPGVAHPSRTLDWVSISSLVCSVTCCLAPIGTVLGVVGLFRTRGGQRDGRWAAVTGLVVGVISICLAIAVVAGFWALGSRAAFEDVVRPGDCVQVTRSFGEVDLWLADCDEPHDAEVAATGMYDERTAQQGAELRNEDFCAVVGGLDTAEFGPKYTLGLSNDSWTEAHPEAGDFWVCFVEAADGQKTRGSLVVPDDLIGA